jgi:signal transduction histidine kinase
VLGEKELLANVSHELRTPLARIRVALELAREGDLERARRYLGEIGTDLEELESLLENVLTAARLDLSAGRGEPSALPFRRARFAADVLLARAAERFETLHGDHELDLEVPHAPVELFGDAALLRRALDNLLDNAAKYSAPGTPVRLAAAEADGGLAVEVADRGVGIGPEDLARLFTPFFRGDPSRTRKTGGVGLGLALAKRIVEAHGGTIALESEVGRGTTVRVRLPAAAAATAIAPVPRA